MTWTGDISRIGKLADRLADLAAVPSRVSAAVSADLAALVQDQFDAGTDPYGDPWAPLAEATLDRGRTPPPLTDTRRLRDGIRFRPARPAGVSVRIEAPYAAPHQTGWSGRQGSGLARPILPARGELPDEWAEAIAARISREFRRAVG